MSRTPRIRVEAGGLGVGFLVGFVVLTLVLASAASYLYLRGDLNRFICSGPCGPSAVAAPAGIAPVDVEDAETPTVAARGINDTGFVTAVAPVLDDPRLGEKPGFRAVDLASGAELAAKNLGGHIPASLTKLLTGYAALSLLGPDHRFTTSVRLEGDRLVLVGGGDPYLEDVRSSPQRADLRTLAERAAKALDANKSYRVGHDLSLFTGDRVPDTWKPSFVSSGIVTEVTPIVIERYSRDAPRHIDQPAWATQRFAELLREEGVDVTATTGEVPPSAGGEVIARIRSAPLDQVVDWVELASNNEGSEMLLRHVAIAAGQEATFTGGTTAVMDVLEENKISTRELVLHDGSGLSRANQISPVTLTELLQVALDSERTRSLVHGLPVGGFSGTLTERFEQAPGGAGWVRAKTGGLNGVVTLAGVVTLPGGRPIAFALMADRTDDVNALDVQAAIDDVVAAMATCTC